MDMGYPIKIWSHNRLQRKSFFSRPSLECLIHTANSFGLKGSIVALEWDGTEICDDRSLEYYIKENFIFIILEHADQWTPPISQSNVVTRTNIISETQEQIPEIDIHEWNECTQLPKRTILQIGEVLETIEHSNQNPYKPDKILTKGILNQSSRSAFSSDSSSVVVYSNFTISCEKFPSDIKSMLDGKQVLGKRMHCLANLVIDELRCISNFIPMSIFRSVAQKLAIKYPDSLIQRDAEQNIISNTPIALITIMRNRNRFLNRLPNRFLTNLKENPRQPDHDVPSGESIDNNIAT